MIFHWSLIDSKFIQVSRTLFTILVDLINAVVKMVSTRLLISESSIPVPIQWDCCKSTSYNSYHLHIHVQQFLHPLASSWYLFLFSPSLNFNLLGRQSPLFTRFFFVFFLFSVSLVVWLRLGVRFVSQKLREVWAYHFLERFQSCAYNTCLYAQNSISLS